MVWISCITVWLVVRQRLLGIVKPSIDLGISICTPSTNKRQTKSSDEPAKVHTSIDQALIAGADFLVLLQSASAWEH